MFSSRSLKIAVAVIAPAIFGTACQQHNGASYPSGIEHVIVIGVDGLSPDGIRKANTPVLDTMAAEGAVKWNVRTALPSSSSTNWASMIMGAGPEQHGILSNEWEKDNATLPPIVKDEEGLFPTIFTVLHEAHPQAEIGAVYNWNGFGRLFEKKAVNYDHTFSTEDSSTTNFIEYLKAKKPFFGFLHLDHVDHAGHHDGHGSPAYYTAVSKADSLIGTVLKAIRDAGMADKTLVIVTADHGGKGYGHGGATPEEAEIAMFLYGKGVKKGYTIPEEVYTYDLAATIAFALQTQAPYAWIGRPIKSAFDGFEAPANLYKGKRTIAAPEILPAAHLYAQAGGLYIDSSATVTIQPGAKDATIRYTLNGQEPGAGSPVYTQPFTLDSSTVVKARSFDKDGNESMTATAFFRIVHKGQGNGLETALYADKEWKLLPQFAALKPIKTWTGYEFSVDQQPVIDLVKSGKENFGLMYKGFLEIDQPGEYTFYLQSDDGSKLYIDNKQVVDNDGSHGVIEGAGSISLEKGKHAIRLEYFNGYGGYWLDAFYKGPGVPRQLIPANRLYLKN